MKECSTFSVGQVQACQFHHDYLCQDQVLLRRNVRNSKYDPLVDEVELVEANPHYAHIRHSDGRVSTVSLKDLAPKGNETVLNDEPETDMSNYSENGSQAAQEVVSHESDNLQPADVNIMPEEVTPPLRRSQRIRKPPVRFGV